MTPEYTSTYENLRTLYSYGKVCQVIVLAAVQPILQENICIYMESENCCWLDGEKRNKYSNSYIIHTKDVTSKSRL